MMMLKDEPDSAVKSTLYYLNLPRLRHKNTPAYLIALAARKIEFVQQQDFSIMVPGTFGRGPKYL